jgi:hypothetical protein
LSLNLHLQFRDINNRLVHEVPLLQTPSEVTLMILSSRDKTKAYLDWVAKDCPDMLEDEHHKVMTALERYEPSYNEIWTGY